MDFASPNEAWALLSRVFAKDVPEIAAGVVEIRAVARIPGSRSKVAVQSHDPDVDPIGACVGERHRRIQSIADELGPGERVDIIPWSDSPERLIALALCPAACDEVTLDFETQTAIATVPASEFAVAIGVNGENKELVSRLSGWNIEIVVADAA